MGWQRRITAAEPRALIRGLIHSDGCRFIAAQRVGGKTYRPNEHSIAIDRRAEVAKLDAFVGPKR